jgi:hypothetical protein
LSILPVGADPHPACLATQYHTTHHKFDTRPGLNITDGLKKLFEKYNLGKVWGKSPQDYTLFRDPTTSNRSVLKMFVEEALPMALSDVPSVAAYRYFVIGTGVLRYDVFQGTFDQNDQLTASPYPDQLWCIPNVPLKDAEATAQKMNQKSSSATSSFSETEPHHARRRDLMEVDQTRLRWLAEMNNVGSVQVAENLTLGYVTQDVSASPGSPPSSRSFLEPTTLIDAHYRNAGRRNQEMVTTRPICR